MDTVEEKNYTVKEVARIAGVTIKALHHYDALGLLKPAKVSAAGYRLYTHAELERLQHILFYRELAIPLKAISSLLKGESARTKVLREQREQLLQRKERLGELLKTLNASIWHAEKGAIMDAKAMFKGFESEEEWNAALEDYNKHLKTTYGATTGAVTNAQAMNKMAAEATSFMKQMAAALKNKIACNDADVQATISAHIAFLNKHGHETTPQGFVTQTKFFVQDSFHRSMLENQQVGLAYYLAAAAEAFAIK